MPIDDEIKRIGARDTSDKEEAFKRWMTSPEVRVLVSMIPEGEKPGLVEMILKAAHNAGWGGGSISTVMQLMRRTGRC